MTVSTAEKTMAEKKQKACDDGRNHRQRVLEVLNEHDKFMVTTHENPDGDALGSMLSMNAGLQQMGKDVVMYMPEDEFPLPREYEFTGLDLVTSNLPSNWRDRTFIYLDCGNIERMSDDHLEQENELTVNIDHHHDNTCFGDVNLVVADASSTAEIVYEILEELGVKITLGMAEALYVALVTDTGKFMYKNTGPKAHLMAAKLLQYGVDPYKAFKELYEDMPFAKITLLARVLSRVERYDEGVITMAQLFHEDYDYAEAEASFSEGIIDHLRAVRGTKVAVLVRELDGDDRKFKVSLRATSDRVDVSEIASNAGGGGHPQASGFTSDMAIDRLISFLRSEVKQQLA